MSTFSLHVPAGSNEAQSYAQSVRYSDFHPGDPLYFSYILEATRVSGTSTTQAQATIFWYDSAGAFISSDTLTTTINASMAPTVMKGVVTPPSNAVYSSCRLRVTPAVLPSQHDVWMKHVRLAKTELFATLGANWGDNLLNRPSNLAGLAGSENIKNSQISIGSNGALSGAGGGQVTLPGLGGGPWATEQSPIDSVFRSAPNLLFNGSLRLKDGNGWALGWDINAQWTLASDGASGNYFVSSSNGTNVIQSDPIPIKGGYTYGLQAEMFGAGLTAGNLQIDVQWYSDAAGTVKVLDDGGISVSGGGWQRVKSASGFTAPASAVSARLRIFTQSATISGGSVAARRIKFWNTNNNSSSLDVPFSDEATNSSDILTRAGTGRRLADGRNTPTNRNFGLRSTYNSLTLTGSDAGTTASIAISASTWNTDWGTVITFPSGTLTGLAFNTKYYIWRNQADPSTSGESYGYSTSLTDALATGKAYLGFCTTPADGGTSTGGSGPGIPDCVHPDAWVEMEDGSFKQARYVEAGDRIVCLNPTKDGIDVVEVESNHIGENERVRLTTESGITVTLSINTPLTLSGERLEIAANAIGRQLPVLDENGFRWEVCTKVEPAGFGEVAHIRCHQATYAAGDDFGRSILTHNPKQ